MNAGNHNPDVFCFHPRSTQKIPRLIIVSKDGILTDVSVVGNYRRHEASVCNGQLLMARSLTYKGESLEFSFFMSFLIVLDQNRALRERFRSYRFHGMEKPSYRGRRRPGGDTKA